MTSKPLNGIRVLDLTSVVVGPACSSRLAQYGAEIIKVESPEGDLMRGLGGISPTGQHSGTYLHLNRGKRNICLNLKAEGSREVMDALVKNADVVIANMRPQALKKLNIDSETILQRYPDKIYCLITGYGSDGPYAGEPTYDSVIQAATGMTGLSLARDGVPRYVPMLICDHVVGEIAAGAIMSALYGRRQTGEGVSLEIPMFETMSAFVLQEHLAQQSFDPPVGPGGDQRLLSPYNKPVQTADGWISFTVNTDSQVRAFLAAVGKAGLIVDKRFATVAGRAAYVHEWFEIRGAPLLQKTTSEWLADFKAADIAAKPCHTLETLPTDPHLQAVGLINHELHPSEGKTAWIRSTVKYNGSYLSAGAPSQPKGWETNALLAELGFDADQINELVTSGAAHVAHGR
ncbi:CaiB/BaiF CoA-transferase family protein [Pseudomonas sp. P1.8]|jgi:crotonobetainyl-CoA:carnitine CoA-transferase CaiB-like acyl-CoA transferase|uniref:CaiB/BaiF CoA transferase family protein n=1 Tax=Pseudomonas sp. P1.8 TaxID=1699310 RepID=UPI00069D8861|nr:CoA transferase [Pseudomonas sp. P1.8]